MKIYSSLLDRLKNQHEAIPEIISKAGQNLFKRPQPEKWNIHDNITHLVKYQPIFVERIHQILIVEEPVFERYTAETDPDFENWRKWETEKLLSTLNADRIKINELILKLSENEINRIGTHPKFGKLTIVEWAEFFLLHEAHHIFTIFQLSKS